VKYSKKVRDKAALICAISASSEPDALCCDVIAEALGLQPWGPERALAYAARSHVCIGVGWTHAVDAEAAALLVEGWTP
jgi:hypothetical protein